MSAAFAYVVCLMCAKYGLHFGEAAGMAFGQGESVDAAEFERLKRGEAEHASQLTEAAAEVESLRSQVAELRAELAGETPEGEHVIDLPGRLRRAWRFAQFRLLVLTLMIAALYGVADHSDALARLFGAVCVFLFGAWSVAQFRKRGLGQMFLKWMVYGAVLMPGGMLVDSFHAGDRPAVFVGVLAVALVLTLTNVSEWLGERIRLHVWESDPVHTVRAWF